MLFSFLNVDKKTELRNRKRKARALRITRTQQIMLYQERAKRIEDAIKSTDVESVLKDSVDPLCNLDVNRVVQPVIKCEIVEEEKSPLGSCHKLCQQKSGRINALCQ